MAPRHSIVVAVEDELSASVIKKLIDHERPDIDIDRVINARGFGQLKVGIEKFCNASRTIPHVIMTDLDRYPCVMALRTNWRALHLPSSVLFRVAVRETEAWLLADREGLSQFLQIDLKKIPAMPEMENDPKQLLINLARRSRRRRLCEELVPEPGSVAPIGPYYNERLSQFVCETWDPEAARIIAPSLDRTLRRLSTFLRM